MNNGEKLHIVNEQEGTQVPFLRGILTRSLQKAGLSFKDAYGIASDIRGELADAGGIKTSTLRTRVAAYLKENGFQQYLDSYLKQRPDRPLLKVVTRDGSEAPFSKAQLADSLEICALPREQIYEMAASIESELISRGAGKVESLELTRMILEVLERMAGKSVADAYSRWDDFSHQGRPLILLIGGTTGSGKSSICSELAHRLDIVRTQSTDMLREVMRLLVPERLLPTLHASSFEAYQQLERAEESEHATKEMIDGFLTQASHVSVGIEGVLKRAENEQVSLILEGVHIHPALMDRIAGQTDALVVPILLAVLKPKRLKKRLVGRGQRISSRRSKRYLKSFKKIWSLQSYLLSEADHYNTPIIPNEDEEAAVRAIMQTVSAYLEKDLAGPTTVEPVAAHEDDLEAGDDG